MTDGVFMKIKTIAPGNVALWRVWMRCKSPDVSWPVFQ